MRSVLSFLVLINSAIIANSNPLYERLDDVYGIMELDLDSAYSLSLDLKVLFESEGNYFGLVKSNFILGYITKEKGEFGKSVIYYLEAIRYSEKAQYENSIKDKISIRKNLSNIFRQFKAYDLASKYNWEAIRLAENYGIENQVTSVKFNEGLNLKQKGEYNSSIDLFSSIIPKSSKTRTYRILNEIGILYKEKGNFHEAKKYYTQLLSISDENLIYRSKALHNLGSIHFALNDLDSALHYMSQSISIKLTIENVDKTSLFYSYLAAGEYYLEIKDYNSAIQSFIQAENIIPNILSNIDNYDLYQLQSRLYHEIGSEGISRKYSNLYSKKLKEHIETQTEIQETDQRYNMDLITKRYFDEVEKQERIADIMLYSKLISGTLLFLLLSTIAYNRYEKIRVRRSIERELIALNIIE